MAISGEFELKMSPQPQDGGPDAPGRMRLDKRHHGALDAIGSGQILGKMSTAPGSGGHVAMAWVSGSLDGKSGSFTSSCRDGA